MNNVLEFKLRKRPERYHVLQWLTQHVVAFPEVGSANVFHGWSFIRGSDGVMYFADCIRPGITEDELKAFAALTQGQK